MPFMEPSGADYIGVYNACYKLAVFMLLVQMYRLAWQPFLCDIVMTQTHQIFLDGI